jgi:DHA1 family inner membrane transport protein
MKPNWAILALAVGAFAIGVTEFSPMGLLPVIAGGLHVNIPTAGMLVTAYALGVMIGAPIMTLGLGKLSRKRALILLMGIFTAGNLLAAVAPNYAALMGARIVTSLCHGAFFGLGSVVAASVAPKGKASSAIAAMFMGLTIANIGGVPAATWVGQQVGWRAAFAGTAVLGVLTMVAVWAALPKGEKGQMPDVQRELKVLTRPAVLGALGTTVMGAGAMFTLFTYVAPVLANVTHAQPAFVTAMLVLIGVGFTVGNYAGGKLADRSLNGTAISFLAALAIIMFAFPLLARTPAGAAVMLFLWGAATFGLVPPVQMRVMQAASEAPGLASSVNIGAFNLGNALGAAVGGGVISLRLGYPAVPLAGGALAALGLAFVVTASLAHRRAAPAHP